jgi:hypothetical protein
MKKTIYILLLIIIGSCSTFEENLDDSFFDLNLDVPLDEIATDLPIVNIEVDQNDFDRMIENFEDEIEIEAHFNLYRNQELQINQELIELEIKGNYSKNFPLKSLGIKFEDRFDNRNRKLIAPDHILPQHSLDFIKAIRLRNSGNDFKQTMLKDLSYSQLAIQADLDVDVAYGEASLVFINEKFYGLLNLRTEANANGMAGLYDVKKGDITLAKLVTGKLLKKNGDFPRIDALVSAVGNKDIAFLQGEIDIDNFIDYMIFQTFITNVDWPHTNVRFYAIKNSKFRFVLYDLDVANWIKLEEGPLELIDKKIPNFVSKLFFALYEDVLFQKQFWNRYQEILETGNLDEEVFEKIVHHNLEKIELVMALQIEKYSFPESMVEWYLETDLLASMFKRRATTIESIVEKKNEEL